VGKKSIEKKSEMRVRKVSKKKGEKKEEEKKKKRERERVI
jgi:hypothetical protein